MVSLDCLSPIAQRREIAMRAFLKFLNERGVRFITLGTTQLWYDFGAPYSDNRVYLAWDVEDARQQQALLTEFRRDCLEPLTQTKWSGAYRYREHDYRGDYHGFSYEFGYWLPELSIKDTFSDRWRMLEFKLYSLATVSEHLNPRSEILASTLLYDKGSESWNSNRHSCGYYAMKRTTPLGVASPSCSGLANLVYMLENHANIFPRPVIRRMLAQGAINRRRASSYDYLDLFKNTSHWVLLKERLLNFSVNDLPCLANFVKTTNDNLYERVFRLQQEYKIKDAVKQEFSLDWVQRCLSATSTKSGAPAYERLIALANTNFIGYAGIPFDLC